MKHSYTPDWIQPYLDPEDEGLKVLLDHSMEYHWSNENDFLTSGNSYYAYQFVTNHPAFWTIEKEYWDDLYVPWYGWNKIYTPFIVTQNDQFYLESGAHDPSLTMHYDDLDLCFQSESMDKLWIDYADAVYSRFHYGGDPR